MKHRPEKDNITKLIPKGWVHYADNYHNYYYNPVEYEILFDNHAKPYCHYYSTNEHPSQPIGLTDYYLMFSKFQGKLLNLNSWDVSKVQNFSGLFKFCRQLRTLDLSGWDCSSVVYADEMCYCCTMLKTVIFKYTKFINLLSMESMWYQCENLTILDLYGWILPKLRSMDHFCEECFRLKTINMKEWSLAENVSAFAAFNNCPELCTFFSD